MLTPIRTVCAAAGRACLWVGLVGVLAVSVGAVAGAPSRVLVIDSYHAGYSWSDRLHGVLRRELMAAGAEVYTEAMDCKRFPAKSQDPLLLDTLTRKYAGMAFRVVVVADDSAYEFALRHGEALWGDTPVVFCGVNGFDFEQLKGHPQVTGVVQNTDAYDTLRTACELMPRVDRVVFIHDDTSTGRGYRAAFERDFVRLLRDRPQMGVRFLSGAEWSTDELLTQAGVFRDSDLVLLSRWSADRTGAYVPEEVFVPRLSTASPVPVWGLVGIGHGTVGGRLVTPESQGAAAARLALQVLRGAAPWSLPVQVSGTNAYTYDWAQLRRWGLSPGRLPRGAVLVNRPVSYWWSHRHLVITAAVLLVVQALLILLLIVAAVRRRHAEARQRDSERRLRLVTEGVELGVFDWYSGGRGIVINSPLAQFAGLDGPVEGCLPPRRLLRRLRRADRHVLLRRVYRCLQGYNTAFECECRVGGDGTAARMLSVHGSVADRNGAGGFRLLGTVRDVTESHVAGQRQLRLERELLEARRYESLGVLASGLAHDFNNLLQPIIGNASMLVEELPAGSGLRPLVEDISSSGRQASELAQKLLTTAGQAPTAPRQIDAARLLERMGEGLRGDVPSDRRLTFEASASAVPAYVDVAQYRQILTSLVANAVEATSPGGRIAVRVTSVHCGVGQLRNQQSGRDLPAGTYARITVEDDGEAIAPEHLDHVFDPFFTTRFLGRGLGLAALAGIVQRHGGAVRVTSALGHGSRFDVYLRAAAGRVSTEAEVPLSC